MKKVLLALALAFAATSANAAFVSGNLTFTDTSSSIYTDNNVVSCAGTVCASAMTAVGSGSSGTAYAGTLSLTAPSELLFTYLGKEAGSTNVVIYDFMNVEIFNTSTAMAGQTVSVSGSPAGPLSFTVTTQGTEISQSNLYFLGFIGGAHVIGLSDNTQATPTNMDFDVDDGIFSVQAVPVPAALPLMATALGLFGFGASRRRI